MNVTRRPKAHVKHITSAMPERFKEEKPIRLDVANKCKLIVLTYGEYLKARFDLQGLIYYLI